MHLKMSSAEVVCCKYLPHNTEAKCVDPEQSDLGPRCLPLRLLKHFSRREKQMTFVAIGELRVNISNDTKYCRLNSNSTFIMIANMARLLSPKRRSLSLGHLRCILR